MSENKADPLREALNFYADNHRRRAREALAAPQPAADSLLKAGFELSCQDQFDLATAIAANVGYVLVTEPQPDRVSTPVDLAEKVVAPQPAAPNPNNLPDAWDYQAETNCVVCSGCMFRYGAEHPDGDGKWTCPNCGDGNGNKSAKPAAPLGGQRQEIAAWLIARDESLICEPVPATCMEWARGKLANGMRSKHSGDCTKESHSCQRCSADHALRDADAILAIPQERGVDRAEIIEECETCIPTNWLDPLLTGPNKVGNLPARETEALLRGIQDRIRALGKETGR